MRLQFNSWVRKNLWRKYRLPTPVFWGLPGSSAGKESSYNVGELGSIPGLGQFPGEGNSYPLQCSGLENSMDCIIHGVPKSWTRLSDFHFHFHTPNSRYRHVQNIPSNRTIILVFLKNMEYAPGYSICSDTKQMLTTF